MFIDKNFNKELPSSANVKWLRPKEIYTNPLYVFDLCNCDLQQSKLGNCFILSVLDFLVNQSKTNKYTLYHILKTLGVWQSFSSPSYDGKFIFQFNSQTIVIDDLLPVNSATNELLFCQNKTTPYELWPALLEKACAKYYGSYKILNEGGNPAEVFENLFAAKTNLLLSNNITDRTKKLAISFIDDSTKHAESISASGIVNKHAYSIFGYDKNFITLKNPWSNQIEFRDQIDSNNSCCEKNLNKASDGVFTMTWEQFKHEFPYVITADLPQPNIYLQPKHVLNTKEPKLIVVFTEPAFHVHLNFYNEAKKKVLVFEQKFKEARTWVAFDIQNLYITELKCLKPKLCHVAVI